MHGSSVLDQFQPYVDSELEGQAGGDQTGMVRYVRAVKKALPDPTGEPRGYPGVEC